ncbi:MULTISPECIES: biopolymer transporter ExbD [unclassified Fibrobacter]|uniref:ExbD/TolR family protein n=1 Tax=unclassified Fibrobacter TaxID=2634177 RepID=UPI000D6D2E8D|nr:MULTISPECIES: biopolymer transporter ExbD [unclassified Fibrobacter]PWJ63711.1 biopolymer transport protein ExbD [Fibrobacter sp. UWR4]PZW69099.1 biopolymer transport protein ExbD [Fibrobacter sp. UWR1]
MARRSRKYGEDVPFSITSMMDMMTIILVFMIKNMDAEGQLLTQAENLILPVSVSKKQPAEVSLVVIIDREYVVVDNKKVVPTDDVFKQEDLCVAPVLAELHERRKAERDAALAANQPGDAAGSVVVQIDKNIPYDVMYKVMATCGIAGVPTCDYTGPDTRLNGYTNVSFAVMEKNGGED